MDEPITQWVTAPPPLRLAGVVDGYLGYKMAGFPPGLHRGLPSRKCTFIVSIGPAIDVVTQTDPRQAPDRYRCVVGGLQAAPALISHDGYQEGVEIELSPLGCRRLFGVSPRELWNQAVELADIVGRVGDELWERLQGITGWPARFAVCDQVLEGIVHDEPVRPELAHAWQSIVDSGGNAAISAVARDVGWTRQHLARRFTQEFGLGPKLAGRVVRFDRAKE